MSTKELRRVQLRRVKVMVRVKRGELKLREAARMLALSYHQTKRLKNCYKAGGAKALVHGSVGRGSNRADPARRAIRS